MNRTTAKIIGIAEDYARDEALRMSRLDDKGMEPPPYRECRLCGRTYCTEAETPCDDPNCEAA